MECGFTLKRERDIITTYRLMVCLENPENENSEIAAETSEAGT